MVHPRKERLLENVRRVQDQMDDDSDSDSETADLSGREPLAEPQGYEVWGNNQHWENSSHQIDQGHLNYPPASTSHGICYSPSGGYGYPTSESQCSSSLAPEPFSIHSPNEPFNNSHEGAVGYDHPQPSCSDWDDSERSTSRQGSSRENKPSKRTQKCRLCANHDIDVEMRGHKALCPYQKEHNCDKCNITMLRRRLVAATQKQFRNQQALREGANIPMARVTTPPMIPPANTYVSGGGGSNSGGSGAPANTIPFPGLPELNEALANMDEEIHTLKGELDEALNPQRPPNP